MKYIHLFIFVRIYFKQWHFTKWKSHTFISFCNWQGSVSHTKGIKTNGGKRMRRGNLYSVSPLFPILFQQASMVLLLEGSGSKLWIMHCLNKNRNNLEAMTFLRSYILDAAFPALLRAGVCNWQPIHLFFLPKTIFLEVNKHTSSISVGSGIQFNTRGFKYLRINIPQPG